MHAFYPVHVEALVISHINFASINWEDLAIAVGHEKSPLMLRKALDIADGESEGHVSLIVRLPVLHEVPDLLDVNPGAGNLPQPSMGWLATSARFSLVALFWGLA